MVVHCFGSWASDLSSDCLSSFFVPDLTGRSPYFPSNNSQSTFLLTFIFSVPFFLLFVMVAAWPYRLCGLRGLLRRVLLVADVFGNQSGDPSKGGVSVAGGIVTLGVALVALFLCAYSFLSSFSAHNEILTPAPNAVQSALIDSLSPSQLQFFFEWWFLPQQSMNCSQVCTSVGGSNLSGLVCGAVSIHAGFRCQAKWLSPVISTEPQTLTYNTSVAFTTTEAYVGSYVRWQGTQEGKPSACHRQFQSIAADDTLLFDSYSKSQSNAALRSEARFRRVYFDVDSTLEREGAFSSPCYADGALFDSLRAPAQSSSTSEIFILQITSEMYPQMAIIQSSAFTLAASIFSILGAAVGLVRPITSTWHFIKGCVRKFPRMQLALSLFVVIIFVGSCFMLQFGFAIKNGLFQSELLLFYIVLMSVGLAAFVVWIAHAVHFCQTNRANGWTQSAPLLSP